MAKFDADKRRKSDNLPERVHAEISEAKCKVCKSPHRREIDMMLATGWGQTSVRNHWNAVIMNPADRFTPNNMSNHARKHLTTRDAAVRRIIEARAQQLGVDIDHVEGFITTKAAVLDTIIHEGVSSMQRGETMVEAREIIEAVKLLDKMEAEWKDTAIDELMSEFRAFMEAVKEVIAEEEYERIFAAFERKRDAKHAPVIRPLTIEKKQAETDETHDPEDVIEAEAIEVVN